MNKYKIIYSDHSKAEMKVAKAWYNAQAKGLGMRLVDEIKLVSNSIVLNPLSCFNKIQRYTHSLL